MSLFARLFLAHLLVLLLAAGAMFWVAELLAPRFYQGHLQHMMDMMGPMGLSLRASLEEGLYSTLRNALLAALPVAALFAASLAFLLSRRVSNTVTLLARGAQEIAHGRYNYRLSEEGPTELAELAKQFNYLSKTLEQVEQSRVNLIGSVAHELRTPLTALQGYAEALSDGVLPKEDAAKKIAREVRAMGRLVEDLSLVSRVEAGILEVHPQPLDPLKILEESQERFALPFAEKVVLLELASADHLPPVCADPERLHQVLSNLLSNALRCTPAGGQVTLGAEPIKEGVRFFVRDTGLGIAPEHQARIFERFYRVDPARSRREGGTGVGLTVAKGLVEAMGGRMGLESVAGKGSTFYFILPFAKA